uniref:Putative C1orf159-like protein n=1 Tax=Crotalus horridus TaxID=35024 RepID=T1E6C8_CROHD
MAVPCVFLLTVLGAEVTSKSSDSLESDAECCMDAMEANSTCLADTQCTPGCYRRWNEDGSSSCVKCENNKTLPAAPVYNLTDCQNDAAREFSPVSNITTVTPETLGVGGPEVAASLILGTFVISLFLILCVASFFYLKRANKLPSLFYRRSKGSIVQSAESASMLSPPSSIRKPRYVRRDRSLASSTTSTTLSAETRVSNV